MGAAVPSTLLNEYVFMELQNKPLKLRRTLALACFLLMMTSEPNGASDG